MAAKQNLTDYYRNNWKFEHKRINKHAIKRHFHILTPELMFARALMDTQANLL